MPEDTDPITAPAVAHTGLTTLHSPNAADSFRCRLTRVLLALFLGLALVSGALYLFTRHNDFPIHYHPDEQSKVNQIGSSRQPRNLNHPLLMLEAANLLRDHWEIPERAHFGRGRDDLQIAIAGRWASASIAAIGVFGFALAAYLIYGFAGQFIVGVMVMLCPSLLVYAHYLKEDATLVGGIGLSVLGAACVIASKRSTTQLLATLLLAIGCAAAASGKYVGAAVVAPALLTLFIARVPRWWIVPARLLLFASCAVAAFVAINARAFEDPWTLTLYDGAQQSFEDEFEHGTTSHDGLRLPTPGLFCIRVAAGEWMTTVWAFTAITLAAGVVAVVRKQNPLSRWGTIVVAYLLTFAIVLAFNAIPFARYALPITVLGYVVAGCGVSAVICSITSRRRHRFALVWMAVFIIVMNQGHRCLQFTRQFADDSRQRLRTWIATNVPTRTTIVADSFAVLDSRGDRYRDPAQPRLRQTIQSWGHASNQGPLQRLAASGVKYVVTAEPNYQRFFVPGVEAVEGGEAEFDRARAFYTTLFARGTLVWSSAPAPPSGGYVDPELRVYDISTFQSDPPDTESEPRRGRWYERFRR